MQKLNNITVGSDPEVFLATKEGEIVSAIPFIPGDKYAPFQIDSLPEGNCIQVDNIMIEYCLPPARTAKELYSSFIGCIDWTHNMLPEGLQTKIAAFAHIDPKYLDHPSAQRFGCERDFNAWEDGKVNPSPKGNVNYRSCGGHIHIGFSDPEFDTQIEVIKALDLFLGVSSIILDGDKERKKLYGKAGCFRPKAYGVEYRVLSNFWLASQELVESMFDGINKAIQFVNEDRVNKLTDEEQLEIQTCINTGDEVLAYKLINKFNLHSIVNKTVSID